MGDVRALPLSGNQTPEQFIRAMAQQLKVVEEEGGTLDGVFCVIAYTDGEGNTNYRGGWTNSMQRERVYYGAGWLQKRAMEESE